MSNFKGWTTENFEEAQRQMLSRRLNKSDPIKPLGKTGTYTAIVEKIEFQRTETPEALAKIEKHVTKVVKKKPARDFIGSTFIGVDPALRAGGFWLCIICRIDNTATFKSCKHLGEFVSILEDAQPAAVTVENSNLQKAVFDKKAGTGEAISVGKNQGVSQAAADIANDYSQIPSGISPKQKGAKVTNDVVFQGIVRSNGLTLTGYKGAIKAAQDQRDAFMLALICEQQYKLHLKANK